MAACCSGDSAGVFFADCLFILFIKQKVLDGKARTFLSPDITRVLYSIQHFVVFIYAIRLIAELKQWRFTCEGERSE